MFLFFVTMRLHRATGPFELRPKLFADFARDLHHKSTTRGSLLISFNPSDVIPLQK